MQDANEWRKIYAEYEELAYPIGPDFNNVYRRTGSLDCFNKLLLPLILRVESIAGRDYRGNRPVEQEIAFNTLRDLRKFLGRGGK